MQFSVTCEGIVVKKGLSTKLIPFDTIRMFNIPKTQDGRELAVLW